jgi:hypothetical protein
VGLTVRHASGGAIDGGGLGSARYFISQIAQIISIAAFFLGLFWLVSIYGDALRDPRFLDGWVLAAGMSLQLGFHIAVKTNRLPPKSVMRWRKVHVFVGYLLIAAFLSHSDFSLPNSGFEWALWLAFVLVTLSGLFGTYISWSLQAKGEIDERVGYDRLGVRVAKLARDVHDIVATPGPTAIGLPTPPYNAWIIDLYTNHLRDFFGGHRNLSSHLIGSKHALKRLTSEIDNLSRYVDAPSQEKLAAIRNLVVEKDRLDFARVHFGLAKVWLFVHVPITYALIVLSVLHVLVIYAFSSGT